MYALLCVLLAACALADDSEERRSKLPYIADAVGNSLPAPSNVPATVGSPVNLLTPDRYEFYTFDESGELVKRLMTLEEIQAIVAAGEETEGLVTFASDKQPTVAFNFSQPSYTKVHNVVTNVQNVLKAQMEAHKNKSSVQPTLDTPDVSDSWSQILPSIFGNTGVDIVPDRTSEAFITPETETIEFENFNENTQSKESELVNDKNTNDIPVKLETTTGPPKFTSTTKSTTTKKITTSSTRIPTESTTRSKTTTSKYIPNSTTKRSLPSTTTTRTTITSTTTVRPKTTVTTTTLPGSSTNKYKSTIKPNVKISGSMKDDYNASDKITVAPILLTTKLNPQYEKFSTFIPTLVKQKTTEKPNTSTKLNKIVMTTLASTTSSPSSSLSPESQLIKENDSKLSTHNEDKFEKMNLTTITTQSISPSLTTSSTELNTTQESEKFDESEKIEGSNTNEENSNEPLIPLFDVAQSISQIASDLGNYAPVPSDDPLDTKKVNNLGLEGKESLEIEIPVEQGQESQNNDTNNNEFEKYVQISTLDPQKNNKSNDTNNIIENVGIEKLSNLGIEKMPTDDYITSTMFTPPNTIDPVLSNSVGDMLSQVINESPDPQDIEQNNFTEEQFFTTQTTENTTPLFDEITSTMTTIEEIETTTNPVTTDSIIIADEVNDKKTKKTEESIQLTTMQPEVDSIITKEKNEHPVFSNNNSIIDTVNSLNVTFEKTESQTSTHVRDDDKKLPEASTKPVQTNFLTKTETTTVVSSHFNNESFETEKKSAMKNSSFNNNLNKIKIHGELPKMDEFKKKFQKVNIDDKELASDRNNSWKLIPTVPPPKILESEKIKQKVEPSVTESATDKNIILDFSNENQGLEVTTKNLGEDVLQFTQLCNELAFRYWEEIIPNMDNKRSFVLSPYSITSMLAMMFMGARGATSGEMNDILKLDDMVTFNPHFTLKNISDSIETSSNSGVAVSAFIRELYSERNKGKILTFYKERAQHFYNGHVEEINFKLISDIIRRRTNLLVKRYTWGKIPEYIKSNSISMHPPLAAFSTNIFETDCTGTSVDGRDGEMYFVVSPNVRQRRLVPVPAVVYKNNFLAGYDPVLDATAAALGNTNSIVSTLFLMPGQQGNVVNAEDLEALEKRLLDSKPTAPTWNRLLRTLLPRIGLELQIPRFSHKSMLNVSSSLKKMGLKELFDSEHADLAGLNGPSKELHLSDIMQLTTFATCGEGSIGEQHHVEEYPEISQQKRRSSRWATMWDEPRDYQRAFHDPHDLGDAMHLPLHLRPRQARLPARNTQPARLKFDRPFLFFVRHNPTGMILYVGRYNPRLLP